MILIIDLIEQPTLILKKGQKILDRYIWPEVFSASGNKSGLGETFLIEIDKFFKKNKINLKQISEIRVKPGKQSFTSNRIAQAIALGLSS